MTKATGDTYAPLRGLRELVDDGVRLGSPSAGRRDHPQPRRGQGGTLRERDRFPKGRGRLVVLSEQEVGETEETVVLLGGRIHRERAPEVLQRLVRLPGVIVQPPHAAADGHRGRVELDRHAGLAPARPRADPWRSGTTSTIAGPPSSADSSSSARRKLAAGRDPVPVVDERHPRERRVRLGQALIELERVASLRLGPLDSLPHRRAPVVHMQGVRIGEPGVGQGVGRVLGDGRLEDTGFPRRWPPGCAGSTRSGP